MTRSPSLRVAKKMNQKYKPTPLELVVVKRANNAYLKMQFLGLFGTLVPSLLLGIFLV